MIFRTIQILALFVFVLSLSFARNASAQVVINEIQISPIGERFIELYNSSNSDIDLTGWYIQRKTATGSSFGSLVTSTQLNGKIIKPNSYFLVSRNQLGNSDIIVDNLTLTETNTIRIRDSKGGDIDQIGWAIIDEGKSYQKISASEWVLAMPTPRVANTGATSAPTQESSSTNIAQANTSVSLSSFPVEPQIIADAGVSTRIVSTGAPITFTGRVFGLKKEPIENARLVWSFGDGGRGEGAGVTHTYYYPGDYIVVLDASSGYYSASDRVAVHVAAPLLALRTGGDTARSFVIIENRGSDEVDLSLWQIKGGDGIFILPQNTILGARKILTLASEVTGLSTPAGSVASLHFPNGTRVEMQGGTLVSVPTPSQSSIARPELAERVPAAPVVASAHTSVLSTRGQEAAALGAVDVTTVAPLPPQESGSLWPWYIGAAFLGALAFFGVRFAKSEEVETPSLADDFEIFEEEDKSNKGDIF